MSRSIDNTQDVMNSRDIQEAAQGLQSEKQDLLERLAAARDAINNKAEDCGEDSEEYRKELEAEAALKEFNADTDKQALLAFNQEGESLTSEWRHGETVIRRSYFVDYCDELCKDVGDIPKDIPIYIAIDWERTAKNIEVDYSTLDFDGVEYLVRSC